MKNLTLSLRPTSLPCFNYIDQNGIQQKVTAIIAPIHLQNKNNNLTIAWACSHSKTCQNTQCRYSLKHQQQEETNE